MSITFKDFHVRYANIRKQYPNIESCSVHGCLNPVDFTELGKDTSCAYHRILFDIWACGGTDFEKFNFYLTNQKARRTAFTKWRNSLGKEKCDELVLMEAQCSINWVC